MSKGEIEATYKMRIVYAALINLNDPFRPRTQKQVCTILNMPSSSVSDQVQLLIKGNFIREKKGAKNQRSDKTYIPANNRGYIEKLIRLDREYSGEYHGANGQGIAYPEHDVHVPTARVHLNGGWIYFEVENEGLIGNIRAFQQPTENVLIGMMKDKHFKDQKDKGVPIDEIKPLVGQDKIVYLKTKLFAKEWTTKGDIHHYGNTLSLNNELYPIHYVRGRGPGKQKFGICVPEIMQIAEDVSDDLFPFVAKATPILNHLEKYADWKFKKDNDGNPIYHAGVKQEIGLDGVLTAALVDIFGESFGDPQVTFIHHDDSIPGGEGEITGAGSNYTTAQYFKAFHNIPGTEIQTHKNTQSLGELESFVMSNLQTIWGVLKEITSAEVAHAQVSQLLASKQPIEPTSTDPDGVMYQ